MNYKIELSYDGVVFEDITGVVVRDSIEIVRSLYEANSLTPNVNNASFSIRGSDFIVPHLLNREEETVCRISLDEEQLFEGIISPNCEITTAISGIQPILLKVEDYTLSRLKRKFSEDVEYINIPVCAPLDPTNSILHKVAALAGVTVDDVTVPTILSIDYQFIAEKKDTYFDSLYSLLFEFGYIFYFNKLGKLAFYNLASAPTDLTTITSELKNVVDDPETNIAESINTSIVRGSKDKISLNWEERKEIVGAWIWKDPSGGTRNGQYWARSAVPGGGNGTFPYSSNKDDIIYIPYTLPEGEVLYATNTQLHYIITPGSDEWIVLYQPFVNYGKKCSFRFWNTDQGGYPHYIANTYVTGNAWVKVSDNHTYRYIPDQLLESEVRDEYEYDCKYIYSSTDADNLANILQNYFKYSANTYTTSSYSFFELGSYVKITDSIHQTFTGYGRIRKIVYNSNGSYTYFVEGIDEYVNTGTSSNSGSLLPVPIYVTPEKLAEGTLPVVTDQLDVGGGTIQDTDFISGTVAGFDAQADKLFLGAGNYNNTDTPFYADTGGKFSLKNKLSFDGTNLSVSGTINAGAGGLIGGANIGADYVQSSNYVVNTSGWKLNNTAGSIEVSNLIANGGTLKTLAVSGTLTIGAGGSIVGTGYSFGQSSATIGGYAIGTSTISATNLVLTSGAANAANITVGTGATAGGLNSAASGTDVVFWAGSTHANRATAAARILANGQSFFTSGTVGGFTLTSSTLTGGNLSLANTGNITAGTSNDVIRISADDASYRLWIGNATAASAPFRVTKAGVLTATSGSFTGTISTSNITATGGTIGGFTLGTTTITGGSLVLGNTGNISAGTSNDIARISADDATYRLWIGNATSSSAPFRVSKAGVLTASGATISGAITATSGSFTGTITTSNITATGGTVGSWILGTDKLSSASTGSRIELNKAKSRVSIFDSGNNEKVVQGYLQGLLKNGPAWDSTKTYVVGDLVSRLGIVYKAILGSTNITPPNATYWQVSTDTWTASDYGFWISPSTTATFDGTIEAKNGGIIASDGGVKVKFGGLDSMLLGTENGRTGLHMNLNSTPVRLTGNSGGLALLMNNIDTSISSPTNVEAKWKDYTAFETSATKGFAFDDQVHVESGLFLGNLGQIYFQNIDRTGYKCILSSSANDFSFRLADTSTFIISDGTQFGDRVGMINLKVANCQGLAINGGLALGHDISRYNWSTYGNANISGYNLNNAEVSIKSGTGTDSNTVYIKDGNGKLKERNIYSGVWTGAASTAGTCTGNAATSTKWATGRTIQLNGAVTGTSGVLDGSQNIGITTTLEAHTHTSSQISDATNLNTANMIVKRDASGNFSAGTITATLNGTATNTSGGVVTGNNIRIPTAQPTTLANGDIWMV